MTKEEAKEVIVGFITFTFKNEEEPCDKDTIKSIEEAVDTYFNHPNLLIKFDDEIDLSHYTHTYIESSNENPYDGL